MPRLASFLVVGTVLVLFIAVQHGAGQTTQKQSSAVSPCTGNDSTVIPHPTNCHQFYNCSIYLPLKLPYSPEASLHECLYPQLFDTVTLQCEDFKNVKCGDRFEPVDGCEYERYRCGGPDCRPCEIYLPTCRGQPDGPNVFKGREWTSFFAVCLDQRTVNTSVCPDDDRLKVQQRFSPDLRKCVSIYEVPAEHGGHYLNCTARADGLYPDDVPPKPDLYFRCTSGALAEIRLCPTGQVFDKQRSDCIIA